MKRSGKPLPPLNSTDTSTDTPLTMSSANRKIQLSLTPLEEVSEEDVDYSQTELKKILKASLERTLSRPDESQHEKLRKRVLELELSSEAILAFESSPLLSGALGERDKTFDPSQKRRIRYWYARILSRAGHYLHGLRIIASSPPQTPFEFLTAGYFQIAFGEIERGRTEFENGHRLDPQHPPLAASYFHALIDGGEKKEVQFALQSLIRLRASQPEEDVQGFLTARIAEAYRKLGQSDLALQELRPAIQKYYLNPAIKGHLNFRTHVLHLIHEEASNLAAIGDTTRARQRFDEALETSIQGRISYPNLLFLFRRIARAGVARPSELELLFSLSNHLPRFDPSGEFLRDFHWSRLLPRIAIDLSRNEFCLPDRVQPFFGIPLEVRLLSWIAVASQPFHALPPSSHHAVRRALLLDLLWKDFAAPVRSLDGRLTKLLKRIETEYGFQVRDEAQKKVLLSPAQLQEISLIHTSTSQPPSYFEISGSRASSPGFAHYYGLSKSQARIHFRDANKTWLKKDTSTGDPQKLKESDE